MNHFYKLVLALSLCTVITLPTQAAQEKIQENKTEQKPHSDVDQAMIKAYFDYIHHKNLGQHGIQDKHIRSVKIFECFGAINGSGKLVSMDVIWHYATTPDAIKIVAKKMVDEAKNEAKEKSTWLSKKEAKEVHGSLLFTEETFTKCELSWKGDDYDESKIKCHYTADFAAFLNSNKAQVQNK